LKGDPTKIAENDQISAWFSGFQGFMGRKQVEKEMILYILRSNLNRNITIRYFVKNCK